MCKFLFIWSAAFFFYLIACLYLYRIKWDGYFVHDCDRLWRAILGQFSLCTTFEAADVAKRGQHSKINDSPIISAEEFI